jgi:hypothetical protein
MRRGLDNSRNVGTAVLRTSAGIVTASGIDSSF